MGQRDKAVILIVEDEPILRFAGVAMLEGAGYEAIEASDADEALRILESHEDVRLVFTDIDMPRGSLNGLKLAATVRKRWPPIAIIVVSGHQVPTLNELPPGSVFFQKPYQDTEVLDEMARMLCAA
jgi:CheY-like chemotaxis protein